jgi:hypothetical protein
VARLASMIESNSCQIVPQLLMIMEMGEPVAVDNGASVSSGRAEAS